jgi:6-phosphogluconolactonase (cycloisomerase 2 family)
MKRLVVLTLGIFLLSSLAYGVAVSWTGKGDGKSWNDKDNWSNHTVPTGSDDVTIGSYTVTADGSEDFANTLTCTCTLILNANMNITSTASFTNLTLMAGSIVNGTLTIATLTMSGGNITTQGNVTVNGLTAVTANATLSASGTVTSNSTINITGNGTGLTVGATFINNGNINIQSDGVAAGVMSEGTINNNGTIAKTVGTATSILSANKLNNAKTVSAQSGTLKVYGGNGTETGTFNADNDATLEFAPGNSSNLYLDTGSSLTGTGTIHMTGGKLTLVADVTVNVNSFVLDAGDSTVFEGPGNLMITSPTMIWNSGSISGYSPSPQITISNKLQILTQGNHSLSVRDMDLKGTLEISGPLTLALVNITIEKGATFNILTDDSLDGNPANINNSGTFEKTGGTNTSTVQLNGTFSNIGTVNAGSGLLSLAATKGTSDGAFTATNSASLGFELYPNASSTWTMNAGTTMKGDGVILIDAIWDLKSPLVVKSYAFFASMSADVEGSDLTIDSLRVNLAALKLQSGNKNPQLPASGCSLTIPKAASKVQIDGLTLSSCTFDNTAAVKITAASGGISLNSSAFVNEAKGKITLDVPSSSVAAITSDASSTVTNSGTITVGTDHGANSTQTISTQGSFSNSGSIAVPAKHTLKLTSLMQTGGATSVAKGGTLVASGTLSIGGGTIGGVGTISGSISNTGGTLAAGSGSVTGTLALNLPETQGAGSTMSALISGTTPGTEYDQINNTSTEALGGTLNLTFGAGFSPAPGHLFDILKFASSTGNFSSVITPDPTCTAKLKSSSTSLSVSFTSSNVSVTISPKKVTLKVNTQQQFTGTVTHGCGDGVTWKVKEGSAGGAITQTGLYTAPGSPGTFHVVVSSVAEPTKSATATVTVTTAAANKIVVTPRAAVVQPGGRVQLRANQSVTWSVAGVSGGNVTRNGAYTAAAKPGVYHVMATSTTDAANHATVNIAVVNGKLKSAYVTNLDKNSVSVLSPVTGNGPSTGQLREVESVPAGKAPVALAISSQGILLSAARESNEVARFQVSSADGTLRTLSGSALETGTRPSAVALDRSERMAFVANRDSDDISVFSVDRSSGQMVLLGKQALGAGDNPSAIAVHPTRPWIYVSGAKANTIRGFAYNAAGMLRPVNQAPLATGIGPSAALIGPVGRFLFTASRGSGNVFVFAIDKTNGTLQEVKGSPFATGKGASAIAIDVTGSYLFVADHESDDVASFQIDSETGGLALVGRTPLAAAGPSALAVDPSGRYVYVTSDQAGGVTSLKLNVSTGALTRSVSTQSLGRASAIVVTGRRAAGEAP